MMDAMDLMMVVVADAGVAIFRTGRFIFNAAISSILVFVFAFWLTVCAAIWFYVDITLREHKLVKVVRRDRVLGVVQRNISNLKNLPSGKTQHVLRRNAALVYTLEVSLLPNEFH